MRVTSLTWWFLGLALVTAATVAVPLWFLVALTIVAEVLNRGVSRIRRLQPSARGYYLLAGIVLVVRIGLRALFGDWPIALADVQAAATEGMRLVAIIFAMAMASQLANPKQLLKFVPSALYELATAVVVALNIVPQLAPSLARVRRAARLRGRSRGLKSFASIAVPTLEDALAQSLELAASMESRGFGATLGSAPPSPGRALARWLGLLAAGFGSLWSVLFGFDALGIMAIIAGLGLLVFGLSSGAQVQRRTRFEPLQLGVWDAIAACLAAALVVLSFGAFR